mgnify:CR=1 FL=1
MSNAGSVARAEISVESAAEGRDRAERTEQPQGRSRDAIHRPTSSQIRILGRAATDRLQWPWPVGTLTTADSAQMRPWLVVRSQCT